jgi:hypothetical protein
MLRLADIDVVFFGGLRSPRSKDWNGVSADAVTRLVLLILCTVPSKSVSEEMVVAPASSVVGFSGGCTRTC